jgi:benzoylformate decarboxylase
VHLNLHTAAGTGNGMGNITTAWDSRRPMIIPAGQQTREMLLIEPYLTNKNPLPELAPGVTCAYEPARAEDGPGVFVRAYAMEIRPPCAFRCRGAIWIIKHL